MALRKWSVIEEELKKAHAVNDIRVLRYLGEVHERLRLQHEQLMQCAQVIAQSVATMEQMNAAFKGLDSRLAASGLKDRLLQLDGDPDEKGSTYHMMREEPGKKN